MTPLKVACAVSVLMALSAAPPVVAREARLSYDIPAQPLDQALLRLAVRSGRQVTFAPGTLQGLTSRPLSGERTFAEALDRLLPSQGARWEFSSGVVVILAAPARRPPAPAAASRPQSPPAVAQAPAASAPEVLVEELEVMAVTGSRGRPRTVRDSSAPIDVIDAAEVAATGVIDTNSVLMTLIPSYAVARNSNNDSATFIRPATLRGLAGDKTLLLVNSKRRHRSAAVGPSAGAGSQAADSATIPVSAVKSIEVLRDGAGGLYGSDAIAGVINFLLRDDDEGGALSVRYGRYSAGDGEDLTIAGHVGAPLTEQGFVNLSFEYSRQEPTSRGRQFCSPAFCAPDYAAQNAEYAALTADRPVQRHGQPEHQAFRAFINSEVALEDGASLYAFASFSGSRATADATYRYPVAGQGVNDVPVRLRDGRVFRFNEIFPAGFTPRYSGIILDHALVVGYRGEGDSGLRYDLSARYGRNRMRYEIDNTVNASLGPGSPRHFKRATYVAGEVALNADFGYEAAVSGLAGPLAVSFGGEYRRESFRMAAGEPLAYAAGPFSMPDPFDFCTDAPEVSARTLRPGAPGDAGIACAEASDPVYNTLAPLTLTVSPDSAAARDRDSYAGYIEASADVTDRLLLNLAGRYERFSDFGSTFDAKVSARFALTPKLNLRGSAGTGFRAPTPGQQTFSSLQVNTVDGEVLQSGLFPVTHTVASYLGAQPLMPERAVNLSAGIAAVVLDSLHLSVDFYQIRLRDQYYAVPPISVTPAIRAAMLDARVTGAAQISRVNFFQNAFDSRVSGFDVVATQRFVGRGGRSTNLTASFNHNRYDVRGVKIAGLFDDEQIFDFENAAPRWKGILVADHTVGRLTATARTTVWGPYRNMYSTQNPLVQTFRPSAYLDLDLTYRMDNGIRITLGKRNIFEEYPAADWTGETTAAGQIYRPDAYPDWQGGFYFAKLEAAF